MSVDLPDPEGPQMTIFSPFPTARLTEFKAVNAPYLLTNLSTMTIGCVPEASLSGCNMIFSPRRVIIDARRVEVRFACGVPQRIGMLRSRSPDISPRPSDTSRQV